MKMNLTLALGAALLLGATAMGTVNAQGAASGPFADVPTDHWAYSSVEKLRDAGIVIGYPDGTYGGHRPMTRYEFATAIARLLPLLGKAGGGNAFDPTNYYTKSDIDTALAGKASQAALDQLRTDLMAKLQSNQDALDNLTKLVNQFQPELQQLGVDVANVKAQLKGISDRLAVVEAEQARVHITGDVNVIGRSDYNYRGNGSTPEDENGYRIGNPGGKNDIFSQPEVYNDILLNIVGRVSDNAQAVVRMDIGSYANYLGNMTGDAPGRATYGVAQPETYNVYEAYLQSPVSLGPLTGASVTAGRFGEQFTDITYKAVNPDIYTNLEQTNSGNVIGDGLQFRFGAGPVKFNAFAEKTDPVNAPYALQGAPGSVFPTNSGPFRPGSFANTGGASYSNAYDQTAGIRAVWGGPSNMTVGVTGVLARISAFGGPVFDPNHTTKLINNVFVYGADISGSLPFEKSAGVTYKLEGALSSTGENSSLGNVNSDKGNEAVKGELGYTAGALNVGVSGQAIYTNFSAPGYWDKFGTWTNPTNIAGGGVNAGYIINPVIKVYAAGDIFQGLDKTTLSPIEDTHDKLNHVNVGAKFTLNSGYTADLGYEWVQYQLKNDQGFLAKSGSPYENYYNIGVGHSINPNATVKVLYQIVDYHDQNTGFDASGAGNNSGGVCLTQLDVKF